MSIEDYVFEIDGKSLFKVFKNDDQHRCFQYKDGVNTDIHKWNPSGSCEKGGLYFTTTEHLYKYLDFGTRVRKVGYHKDYLYTEEGKWKTHSLYLGEALPLDQISTMEYLHSQGSRCNLFWVYMARNGHLEVLKWLYTTYGFTTDDARVKNNHAFSWAAENGHLNVLEWLHTTFDLTAEDARVEDNYAFRWAAFNGNLEVLKWLHNTYNLTAEDARSEDNYSFRWAALQGHLHVLKWLHTTYNLTVENARAYNNYAFRCTAQNGHLEVLKWLHNTYNLSAEDARTNYNEAFYEAAANRHPKVLKWLEETFPNI